MDKPSHWVTFFNYILTQRLCLSIFDPNLQNVTYMLLTYYCSRVCAEYFSHENVTSNRKKHKCQSMSEHLQDPENTSGLRGLTVGLLLTQLSFNPIHWVKITHSWEDAIPPHIWVIRWVILTQHY